MKLYLHEFPDFDHELPELNGFVDVSWHSDFNPTLSNGKITIYCDYLSKDIRKHNDTEGKLYTVNDHGGKLFESDNIEEVREFLCTLSSD